MEPDSLPTDAWAGLAAAPIVALGLSVRVAAAIEIAAPSILPALDRRSRLALGGVLTGAALPTALATAPAASVDVAGGISIVALEACIGLAFGLALVLLASGVAWAGEIAGTAAGLSWSDDGDEEDSSAGLARLARWVALGALVSAGGLEAIAAHLVDGVRRMPVGSEFGASMPWALGGFLVDVVSGATGVAVAMAMPLLVAVLAFQATAALVLRAGRSDAGQGIVGGATMLVVAAGLFVLAGVWGDAAGSRLLPGIDQLVGRLLTRVVESGGGR